MQINRRQAEMNHRQLSYAIGELASANQNGVVVRIAADRYVSDVSFRSAKQLPLDAGKIVVARGSLSTVAERQT